jgi:hypothetical protein
MALTPAYLEKGFQKELRDHLLTVASEGAGREQET